MKLTRMERNVLRLKTVKPHLGFVMIGRELGISDSEARMHYDNAKDKSTGRPIQKPY